MEIIAYLCTAVSILAMGELVTTLLTAASPSKDSMEIPHILSPTAGLSKQRKEPYERK